MTTAPGAASIKANGPGATEPNADTRIHTQRLPHWLRPVNALPRYPDEHCTAEEWSAYWALDVGMREEIELAHRLLTGRNRHAVDHVYKHGLRRCNRSGELFPLGVAAIGHRFEVLPFELVALNQPGKVYWQTVFGTPVGTCKGPGLVLNQRTTHILDIEGLDRRHLFEGRFLVDGDEGWKRMLDPRDISARDEYAARLYLCMRRLGAHRPGGGNVRAAITRLRAQVERVPE